MARSFHTIEEVGEALVDLLSWLPRRGIAQLLREIETQYIYYSTNDEVRGWLKDVRSRRGQINENEVAPWRLQFQKTWQNTPIEPWIEVLRSFDHWADEMLRRHELSAIRLTLTRRRARMTRQRREVLETALIDAASASRSGREWSEASVVLAHLQTATTLRSQLASLAIVSLRTLVRVRRFVDKTTRFSSSDYSTVETSEVDVSTVAVDLEAGPAEQAERKELAGLLARAISELPLPHRAVIRATMEGLGYREISAALKVSKSTISRLHQDGLLKLAVKLGQRQQ